MNDRPSRGPDLLLALLLLLLPAVLLHDCVFGGRRYQPFDLAEYPPVGTSLSDDQIARMRDGANYDPTEATIWFPQEWGLARQAILAGQYPHWNPTVRAGAPLAAHGHIGLHDPLHWPALLCADPVDGLLVLSYTMFALAGLLMFGLLRALAFDRLAALFGAVAFAWSGTLTANGHWYMRMEPIALLPGMLWAALAIARGAGRRRALPATMLALLVCCCWTAGFPAFCIPVSMLLGLFGIGLVLRATVKNGIRDAMALALWLAFGVGLGLALAAPQLLPQIEFYPHSNRTLAPTLERAAKHAFAPMGLLGYVFPDLFSHPVDRLVPGDRSALAWLWSDLKDWQSGAQLLPNYNFTEYSLFPGTFPIVFAGLGLLLRGPFHRFVALLAIVLLFLLGTGAGPFWHALELPVLQAVPTYRFVGPACAFLAFLAACGFQALRRSASTRGVRWFAGLVAIAGAGCLLLSLRIDTAPTTASDPWIVEITERYRKPAAEFYGLPEAAITPETTLRELFTAKDPKTGESRDLIRLARERMAWNLRRGGAALLLAAALLLLVSLRGPQRPLGMLAGLGILLFTGAELWFYGNTLNRGREPSVPLDSEVHRFLRQQRDEQQSRGGFTVARGNGDLLQLPGGTLAPDGIRDLAFYTFVDRHSNEPIRKAYGDAFLVRDWLPGALPDDARLQLPWWDLFALRYVLTTRPMQFAGKRVGPELRGPQGEFFVYERESALPRAFVVPALRQVADDQAAVDAIVAPDLRPRESVLITPEEAAKLGAPGPADPACAARQVEFLFEDSKRLTLRVGGGPAGYLVLADAWFPGWTATIGERSLPIARGNVWQRVVSLPAGPCDIHFRYSTPGLRLGVLIGASAALLWLGAALAGLRSKRPTSASPWPSSPLPRASS
ncbi:MAG: hypothetical protein IPK26_30870 [Planctomycetes bacterium]|nr:hypothetical protein [Planctomycetota bacterium]